MRGRDWMRVTARLTGKRGASKCNWHPLPELPLSLCGDGKARAIKATIEKKGQRKMHIVIAKEMLGGALYCMLRGEGAQCGSRVVNAEMSSMEAPTEHDTHKSSEARQKRKQNVQGRTDTVVNLMSTKQQLIPACKYTHTCARRGAIAENSWRACAQVLQHDNWRLARDRGGVLP
eukprot:IDg19439t1